MSRLKRTYLLAGLVLASSFMLFWHLGSEPFQDYDESAYGEIVQESVTNGNYLTFTYFHKPFLEKPPLYFWLSAASLKAFPSKPELAMRLPSALSGLVLILATILTAWLMSQSFYIGLLGGAMLLSMSPFLEGSRQARFDILVSLWIVLAAYAFLKSIKGNPRSLMLVGLFIGLAVLSKSVIAIFALVVIGFLSLFHRSWDWIRSRYCWIGIAIAAGVSIPWHIYEVWLFGFAFMDKYLFWNVFQRYQTDIFVGALPYSNLDYVRYLETFTYPWNLILVIAPLAAIIWQRSLRDAHAQNHEIRDTVRNTWAMLSTAIVILGAFFLSSTKATTYLLPAYPFMAIAAALSVSPADKMIQYSRLSPSRKKTLRILGSALLIAGFAFSIPFSIYSAYHFNPYYSNYVGLASDEKTIGLMLREDASHRKSASLYAYKTDTLGSIMFYSGMHDPYALTSEKVPASGSFIILNSSEVDVLQKEHPSLNARMLFGGPYLALLLAQ